MTIHRTIDAIRQWWRYPQPTRAQKKLLGLYTDSFDTDVQARLIASQTSAQYIIDSMPDVTNFPTDYDLHESVSNWVDPKLAGYGLFCEFGVATGRTLNHFAKLFPERIIYGFDGFEGLPEDWGRMKAGHFAQKLPKVRDNCELIVGWFDNTLPKWLPKHKEPIALLHMDADLYSSTVTVLECLRNQIVPNTIIVFDEYMNYPNWERHEFLAWKEFVAKHDVEYEYIGYVSKHQQCAVRVKKIG